MKLAMAKICSRSVRHWQRTGSQNGHDARQRAEGGGGRVRAPRARRRGARHAAAAAADGLGARVALRRRGLLLNKLTA